MFENVAENNHGRGFLLVNYVELSPCSRKKFDKNIIFFVKKKIIFVRFVFCCERNGSVSAKEGEKER